LLDAGCLVRIGLQVTRLPGKLPLYLAIWLTPEAIYLQLVGGCVQWWHHFVVKRCGYRL